MEASVDLASGVWTSVTNSELDAEGRLTVSDPDSVSAPARYYRIVFP